MGNTSSGFDFLPIGQEIKKARKDAGLTREELSEKIGCVARHLQSIENEGQYPSLSLFIELMTMFNISVDQYIFPDTFQAKSSVLRQLISITEGFSDAELSVLIATAKALRNMRSFE